MATVTSAVTQFLDAEQVAYQVIEIPLSETQKPIRSLESLLSAQGLDPGSVVRSIVFKGEQTGFCLLAVAGTARADWALLRAHLQERKCRMAEYDEVLAATGYPVGAVPPLALPTGLRVLLDQHIQQYARVVIGSGVLGFALSIMTADLFKLIKNSEIGNFIKVD